MRTRAIILKKQNTGEYDQLVTCYTEEFGKLTAVAKSALKPNSIQAMHLDILNLVDFELINGRATPIITGAQAENTHHNLKNNLPSLAGAYFFAEVFDRLVFDYQRDDDMWNFLTGLLGDLDHKKENFQDLFREKQANLIDLLGYSPNLSECIFCFNNNLEGLLAYSPEGKGMICKNCFLGGQVGIVIKPARLGGNKEFLSVPVMNAIFESLIERRLNSLNLIRAVIQ